VARQWRFGWPYYVCFNKSLLMPKMKTHSGAKKRFRKTAKGKLRARHAFTSHNLGKKRPKRKRRLGEPVEVVRQDRKRVRKLLG
jgi:large subunit ribosomal protein L35